MIELTHKDRATVEEFERRIAVMDPVVECRRMFGVPDYLVRVAVADTAAYEAFYMNELAELPGIGRVSSQFMMKLVKGLTCQIGKTTWQIVTRRLRWVAWTRPMT